MNRQDATGPGPAERLLQHEYVEVEAAIAMVREGNASVVSVTGLRFGEAVVRRLRAAHADRGVVLEPQWWPDDEGCDIVVRRSDG